MSEEKIKSQFCFFACYNKLGIRQQHITHETLEKTRSSPFIPLWRGTGGGYFRVFSWATLKFLYIKIGGTGIRTQDNGFANRGLSPLGDAAALLNGFYNTIKGKVRQEVFPYPHISLNLRSIV